MNRPFIHFLIFFHLTLFHCLSIFSETHFFKGSDWVDLARQILQPQHRIETILFVPDDQVKEVLIGLINAESKCINATCYRITDGDIAQALFQARQRGVHIELIVDAGGYGTKYDKSKELKQYGVKIYIYEKFFSIMHNKFFIFGKNMNNKPLIWTGSANATGGGLSRNQENVIILDSIPTIKKYIKKFYQLKNTIMTGRQVIVAYFT